MLVTEQEIRNGLDYLRVIRPPSHLRGSDLFQADVRCGRSHSVKMV